MNTLKKLVALLFAMLSMEAFAITDAQVFAWASANYPNYFSGTPTAGQYQQYDYRFYPGSQNYLAVDATGVVYVLGPISGGAILPVGTTASFANTITAWEATLLPKVLTNVNFPNLFTGSNGRKVLPTYISALISSATYPLANIFLENKGDPLTAQVTVDLPVYGAPTTQTVTLAAGELKTVQISPTINFTQLFQGVTNVPANIGVKVVSGNSTLFDQSTPIDITGRNTVFWSNAGWDIKALTALIATMVTPHDRNGAVNDLVRGAGNRFPARQMIGYYQSASWPQGSYTLAPGDHAAEYFNLLTGESPSVIVDKVVNSLGLASTATVFIMDEANYTKWSAGQAASMCGVNGGSLTAIDGTSLQCTTPIPGNYYIVYYNPPTNYLNRIITRHRPMTKWEITYYQAKAIFDELRSRGLTYVDLKGGTGFFSSSQNVLYPSESIRNLSANCIDGSLLFASAFEALGMEPLLEISFTAGHAMVAVRVWSGENTVIPIETTVVGNSSYSFDDAYASAITKYKSWITDGSLISVDIKKARAAGITPAPM